jgi:histidinol-phosphate phosphatase family protein
MKSNTWTLFLDRDGVINKKKQGGYIQNRAEFEFLPGVLNFFKDFSNYFDKIVIVTNQQGISKGLMTIEDLTDIHSFMTKEIINSGGKIDKIYFCADLAINNPICRKPNIGMGLEAKKDFPDIDFSRSFMVGDSDTDIEFGTRLGMKTVWIDNNSTDVEKKKEIVYKADYCFESLKDFVISLNNHSIVFKT